MNTMNAGVFGGLAGGVSFGLSYLLLKLFKVKEPVEHKAFFFLLGGFILGAYAVSYTHLTLPTIYSV